MDAWFFVPVGIALSSAIVWLGWRSLCRSSARADDASDFPGSTAEALRDAANVAKPYLIERVGEWEQRACVLPRMQDAADGWFPPFKALL